MGSRQLPGVVRLDPAAISTQRHVQSEQVPIVETDAQGVLHSRTFPSLRLPVAPPLAGETAKVLAALAQNEMPMGKQSENSVVNEDPFTTGKSTCAATPPRLTFLP